MSLEKEIHRERINDCRKSLETFSNNKILNGSGIINKFNDLDNEVRYLNLKNQLEKYLQEAIDDGYPELTI